MKISYAMSGRPSAVIPACAQVLGAPMSIALMSVAPASVAPTSGAPGASAEAALPSFAAGAGFWAAAGGPASSALTVEQLGVEQLAVEQLGVAQLIPVQSKRHAVTTHGINGSADQDLPATTKPSGVVRGVPPRGRPV